MKDKQFDIYAPEPYNREVDRRNAFLFQCRCDMNSLINLGPLAGGGSSLCSLGSTGRSLAGSGALSATTPVPMQNSELKSEFHLHPEKETFGEGAISPEDPRQTGRAANKEETNA